MFRLPECCVCSHLGSLLPRRWAPGPRASVGLRVEGVLPIACSPAGHAALEWNLAFPRFLGSWAPRSRRSQE